MRNRASTVQGMIAAFAVAALVGFGQARDAFAAPPSAPPKADVAPADPSTEERAAELYRAGNKLYDQGKFVEAEASYQEAWNLQRSFDVAGNLGNVELEVGQPRDAAEHLAYALEIFPLGEKPEKKRFLVSRLAKAMEQVGTLTIAVSIDGADVYIDGKRIGVSPLPRDVYVEPGMRSIEIRRGIDKAEVSLLIAKGSDQRVTMNLDTGPNMKVVLAGGAAGLLGIASGVTFAILSSGRGNEAEEAQLGSQQRKDLRTEQTTFANVSFFSFLAGGAVLAGTAVYALTTARAGASTEKTGLQAAPLLLAGGGGVSVGARW